VQPRDGRRCQPPAPGPAGSALTQARTGVIQNRGDATSFRCGGCGAAALFVQCERGYGRLVADFFDRHEWCGGAVEISAAQPPADTLPVALSLAPG
jgi:hypothetical protein